MHDTLSGTVPHQAHGISALELCGPNRSLRLLDRKDISSQDGMEGAFYLSGPLLLPRTLAGVCNLPLL